MGGLLLLIFLVKVRGLFFLFSSFSFFAVFVSFFLFLFSFFFFLFCKYDGRSWEERCLFFFDWKNNICSESVVVVVFWLTGNQSSQVTMFNNIPSF
jgi:hypothetical protein